MREVDMDRTDRRILTILQKDGRLTNAELAQRVNLRLRLSPAGAPAGG